MDAHLLSLCRENTRSEFYETYKCLTTHLSSEYHNIMDQWSHAFRARAQYKNTDMNLWPEQNVFHRKSFKAVLRAEHKL